MHGEEPVTPYQSTETGCIYACMIPMSRSRSRAYACRSIDRWISWPGLRHVREQVTEVLNCIHQMELVHIQRTSGLEDQRFPTCQEDPEDYNLKDLDYTVTNYSYCSNLFIR